MSATSLKSKNAESKQYDDNTTLCMDRAFYQENINPPHIRIPLRSHSCDVRNWRSSDDLFYLELRLTSGLLLCHRLASVQSGDSDPFDLNV